MDDFGEKTKRYIVWGFFTFVISFYCIQAIVEHGFADFISCCFTLGIIALPVIYLGMVIIYGKDL